MELSKESFSYIKQYTENVYHLSKKTIKEKEEWESAERLARLFRDNIWKLHGLLKSIVSDKRL